MFQKHHWFSWGSHLSRENISMHHSSIPQTIIFCSLFYLSVEPGIAMCQTVDNICVNRGFFSHNLLCTGIYILWMECGEPGIIHQKDRSIIKTKEVLNLVVKGIWRPNGWQLKGARFNLEIGRKLLTANTTGHSSANHQLVSSMWDVLPLWKIGSNSSAGFWVWCRNDWVKLHGLSYAGGQMCCPEQTLLERELIKIVTEICNPVSVSSIYLGLGFNTSNVMYFSPSDS